MRAGHRTAVAPGLAVGVVVGVVVLLVLVLAVALCAGGGGADKYDPTKGESKRR